MHSRVTLYIYAALKSNRRSQRYCTDAFPIRRHPPYGALLDGVPLVCEMCARRVECAEVCRAVCERGKLRTLSTALASCLLRCASFHRRTIGHGWMRQASGSPPFPHPSSFPQLRPSVSALAYNTSTLLHMSISLHSYDFFFTHVRKVVMTFPRCFGCLRSAIESAPQRLCRSLKVKMQEAEPPSFNS